MHNEHMLSLCRGGVIAPVALAAAMALLATACAETDPADDVATSVAPTDESSPPTVSGGSRPSLRRLQDRIGDASSDYERRGVSIAAVKVDVNEQTVVVVVRSDVGEARRIFQSQYPDSPITVVRGEVGF